ncbi:MAG: hypothetical protein AB1779_10210, partial [Candidatus Thermoplasmatota archaeon]
MKKAFLIVLLLLLPIGFLPGNCVTIKFSDGSNEKIINFFEAGYNKTAKLLITGDGDIGRIEMDLEGLPMEKENEVFETEFKGEMGNTE